MSETINRDDLISRKDALNLSCSITWRVGDVSSVIKECFEAYRDHIESLPSAEAEPTVIRSRTFMPTKDFKEWAKRIRETNPNAVVIPCDAEVVSADRPHGEWNRHELFENPWYTCSVCNCHGRNDFNFCPNCGADMRGGDE